MGAHYSAYAPDLPGCVAAGASVEETLANMRDVIAFHLRGLREDGLSYPRPIEDSRRTIDLRLGLFFLPRPQPTHIIDVGHR
ncbi:MAG: type II toxin-antitoxin system HicB family antitoxin [Thermaerobacter sp.]|nr:type II toxin-antitoxin system HicB family antitoxin [Thermaerobacter sp.]